MSKSTSSPDLISLCPCGRVYGEPHKADCTYVGGVFAPVDSPSRPSMPNSTDALLAERGKTHGDYTDHARITQAFKAIMHAQPNWALLSDHEKETLEMLALKQGRILAGDPHFVDHWDDIAGYAKLTADRNRAKSSG